MQCFIRSELRSLGIGRAILLCCGLLFAAAVRPAMADEPSIAGLSAGDSFETRIRPVLAKYCYECHGPDVQENGLRVDSRPALLAGGDSGPAISPGDAASSLLIKAVGHHADESLQMPPDDKLPDAVINALSQWISTGAAWPATPGDSPVAAGGIDWPDARQFWAFRPPARYEPPMVKNSDWPRRRIDHFVLDRMERSGLAPSPKADRRTLIRRVSFDLTGLPPTAGEVQEFVEDTAPVAYLRLVDRLLQSPRLGQHWARMWLDVARYAEDQAHIVGNNKSLFYPNAYLYRDWVIDALNRDLPYDEFIRLQLAADLIEPEDTADHAALGFLGLGPKYYGRGSQEVQAEEWSDRVDTVMRGLQGLTVACARCHDHKYDPVPTEDYYALAGVFASTEMFNRPLKEDSPRNNNGQAKKPEDSVHIVREGKPRDINVFVRGSVDDKGPLVKRRFPQVLSRGQGVPFSDGSGRLDLSNAIADSRNPLTARVIVNRIWQQYFGRALVGTPSNFGALGERPSHPRLLDDLAVRFMDSGWSLKWLHREIVLSATYRQSSTATPEKLAADQPNRLLSRMNRRRLGIEAWRDGLLLATGTLDDSLGGPSFEADSVDERRRSVYSRVSRLELNSVLSLFDFPDPNAHAARRAQTTTPLQKLFVLNSPFMARRAELLAERLIETSGGEPTREAIDDAYLRLFARNATDEEAQLALAFVSDTEGPRSDRWQQYAQVLLATNELLFID